MNGYRYVVIILVLTIGSALVVNGHNGGVSGATLAPQNDHLFENSPQAPGVLTSNAVALGDLDGDGALDAFVANATAPNEVWFNNERGIFIQSDQSLGNASSQDVVLADFDGDGDLDAFVANGGGSGEADAVWVNQGGAQGGFEGFFDDSGQMVGNAFSMAAAVGDVDGDGDPDVLVGELTGSALWINQGGDQGGMPGVLMAGTHSFGEDGVEDVVLADLDNDDDVDAVIARYDSPSAEVWWNDGAGEFTEGPTLTVTGDYITAVAVARMNRNTLPDVVLISNSSFVIWWSEGGQTFSEGLSYGSSDVQGGVLGDVNKDGNMDLMLARHNGSGSAFDTVWLSEGNPLAPDFSRDQILNGSASRSLALGDLDGDSDVDLFTAAEGANQVWHNQTFILAPLGSEFVTSGQAPGFRDSNDVALGDVNGDGHLDAFVANSGPNAVWLNNGCADFASGEPLPGALRSTSVALGDLDGDGDLDAMVVNDADEAPVAIWLNGENENAEGVFSHSGQIVDIPFAQSTALGDLDGDGDLDAVVAALDKVYSYLNGEEGDAAGVFRLRDEAPGGGFDFDIALADLDGDGYLDAFVGGYGPNRYLKIDQNADFVSNRTFGDNVSSGVALADVDGDGNVDVFVANQGPPAPNEVWINNLPFSFDDSGQRLGNSSSQGVATGDFNGDGAPDAFVANLGADRVWLNNGAGIFTDSGQALGDSFSRAVDVGDLDGDGDLDVFVAADGANHIWLNNGRTTVCQCVVEWLSATAIIEGAAVTSVGRMVQQAGQSALDLLTFFRVRDEILGGSPHGQRYRDLYYTHDAEIRALLLADSSLRDAGFNALQVWQPNLQALVEGHGDEAMITADQVAGASAFLSALSDAASPALQQTIAQELDRLPPPETFIGMTMEEARAVTVGHGVYLPAFYSE